MSIRWKIVCLCLVLALLPVMILNEYSVKTFDHFTRNVQEEQMISYARVVADEVLRLGGESLDIAFGERLQQYEQRFDTRLQVVGTNGVILADSSDDPDVGRNVRGDREIGRALSGSYGARTYLLPDRTLLYYYIALPVKDGENVVGAVRAIAHTQKITRAIAVITADFRRALILVAGISALSAIILSLTITRRLRKLTYAARRFAKGESDVMLSPKGRDEIGQLTQAFSQMATEISDRSQRQSSLMATTVHELKTPITAIKGAVQILRDEGAIDDPVACKRFLSNIDISSDRLLRMVEQLAVLSKLRAEQLRGRKQFVDYGAFVDEVIHRMFPVSRVKIEVDVESNVGSIWMIPDRVEQVLANLVENAIRYTTPDGNITIRVCQANGYIETYVEDNGSGIQPADQEHIFTSFYSTVSRNELHEYGMGLGLSIAQTIVQNHGGTISVKSEPGQGSTFVFTLPI